MLLKNSKRLKQIAISATNYEKLRMLGHTRDIFNDVLGRLLEKVENKGNAGVTSSDNNSGVTQQQLSRKLLYQID
jgi:predicted CopG family antitoxin